MLKNKIYFLLLGLTVTLPFTSKSWAGLKVDSNGYPTIKLEPGDPCYTDSTDWVATVFETNCNDAYQAFIMDDGGAGYAYCPTDLSTLTSNSGTYACTYNAMNLYGLEGYTDLVTCVSKSRTQGKRLYDWQYTFKTKPSYISSGSTQGKRLYDWQYTFKTKPSYISSGSASTTSRAGSYFEDMDSCDTYLDGLCESGEYYEETEYTCVDCPDSGYSTGGLSLPITDCYKSSGSATDATGTYTRVAPCYYQP